MIFMNSLFKLCYHPLRTTLKPCNLSLLQARSYAYDGAGKTTATVLNKDKELGLFINAYSNAGFRLNNGILIIGPIILFPRSVLAWKIGSYNDVNEESLNIFKLLEPKVDILIIGIGTYEDAKVSYNNIKSILNVTNSIEVLSTARAIGSYNFLVAEGRNVAAALLPPSKIELTTNDLMNTGMNTEQYMMDKKWLGANH